MISIGLNLPLPSSRYPGRMMSSAAGAGNQPGRRNAMALEATRRDGLKVLAAGAAAVLGAQKAAAQPETPILMDGHVHITNRVYWEGRDPGGRQPVGWDYAPARDCGVNGIVEDIAPYGDGNCNSTPK